MLMMMFVIEGGLKNLNDCQYFLSKTGKYPQGYHYNKQGGGGYELHTG